MLAKEILDGQNIRHWRGVILDQRVQIFMMLYKVACPKNDEQIEDPEFRGFIHDNPPTTAQMIY